MIIAQITDTHITCGPLSQHIGSAAKSLRRIVARLVAMDPPPDVVIATGDLAQAGKVAEYRRFRSLVAPLPMPLYIIPGNHDSRRHLRSTFADHSYLPPDGPIQYAIDDYALRLIGLDTTQPRHSGFHLDRPRIEWLDATLSRANDRPTFLFIHQPPFRTGTWVLDWHATTGTRAFGALLERHRHIVAVVTGHIHHPLELHWHGTLFRPAPSTALQLVPNLGRTAPRILIERPAFALHRWDGHKLATQVHRVG